ncbi:hypothetical protein D3C85_1424020 [compost metagenome]
MPNSYIQEIIAYQGQTEVSLNTNYRKGINMLEVYLNGQTVAAGANNEYIELSPKSIKFNSPLTAGDIIKIRIEGSGDGTLKELTQHIVNEIPLGEVDGSNREFIIKHPIVKNTEEIFINGVLMSKGEEEDYIVENQNIIFTFPVPSEAKVKIKYRRNILPYI